MKAVVQDRYGTPTVLRIAEVDVPVPDETSVLLRVRAASINALDWRLMSGKPFIGRFLGLGVLAPKRKVRGVDVAGEVRAVRKKDSRFRVGDAVFGLGSGSFAEYTVADESEIALKPPEVGFEQAATLGIAPVTALQGLRDKAQVRPGQSVLITSGASGVGSFAVQIAKWQGAHVTAVTSTPNVELVRSLGADVVIDYTKERYTERPERYDAVLDISGMYSLADCWKVVKPGGVFVLVGTRAGVGRFIRSSLRRKLRRNRIVGFFAKVNPEDLRAIGELVAQGKVRAVIDREYPLDDAVRAMTEAYSHHVRGKLVIRVA